MMWMLYHYIVVKLAEGKREAVDLVGQAMSPCSLMVNELVERMSLPLQAVEMSFH